MTEPREEEETDRIRDVDDWLDLSQRQTQMNAELCDDESEFVDPDRPE